MSKTPTAEEVLDRYRELLNRVTEFDQGPPDDKKAELAAFIAAGDFADAWTQYEDTRGPVTREWFVERFGAEDVWGRDGGAFVTINKDSRVFCQGAAKNPTRADIETLVRVLGGEA